MNDQILNFQTLADQGLAERFDLCLANVLNNLADINTDPKTKRTITVQVTFTASEDRSVEEHKILVSAKLAPIKPMVASGFLEQLADGPTISTQRTAPVQQEIEWSAN